MIYKIADNITSPLGFTTEENLNAVRQGRSRLRLHSGKWGLPEPFMASLFDEEEIENRFSETIGPTHAFTRFEQLALLSATQAIGQCAVDTRSPGCIFILATTKGNVALLDENHTATDEPRLNLAHTAQTIARHFDNPTTPLVVSNACTSGLCAEITAMRLLQSGAYHTAVVIGADTQSAFVVSGFQSLKALSPHPCRPFCENRMGLNLGEAAATIILRRADMPTDAWQLTRGAIRNDAYHLSGPSKTATGGRLALEAVCHDLDTRSLAVINAHGTATLYNDEMEAKAIALSGLAHTPVNGYKGCFGHTMGAAGVLETVLTMRSLDEGMILPTQGFDELGVSQPIQVVKTITPTHRRRFIKMMSGFGGSNAALLCQRPAVSTEA